MKRDAKLSLIGKAHGAWTIIGLVADNRDKVICRCECGAEKENYVTNLVRGYTVRCAECRKRDKKPKRLNRGNALWQALGRATRDEQGNIVFV